MYIIDKEIIEKATKCDRNFECLTEGVKPSCFIEYTVENKVFFLKKLNRFCSYCSSFGYKNYCSCPVRQAIYLKYKE